MSTVRIAKDRDWVTSAFMITSDENLDKLDQSVRFFSTASMKFNDTTPGGGFAINPPPQFTTSADPKADSLFTARKDKNGNVVEYLDGGERSLNDERNSSFTMDTDARIGRYYSEAIDDNSQLIHMRFGVPKFNSLITFFTSFYNSGAGRMARTGRLTSALYEIGRVAGLAMQIYAPPLLYLQVANFVGTGIRFMMGKPSSKFYYLKPTMPLYWNAVNTMVNHIGTLKNIVPRVGDTNMEASMRLGQSESDLKYYAKMLPDIFSEDGTVNVYGLATRAQRKYRRFRQRVSDDLDTRFEDINGVVDAVKKVTSAHLTDTSRQKNKTLREYMDNWMKNSEGQVTTSNGDSPNTNDSKEAVEKLPDINYEAGERPKEDGFWKFFEAELDDGAAFVTFRVNYTGSVQESFSSSVGESEIASSINGMSSKVRSTNFNIANGNVAGILGDAIQGVKDFAAGVSDQLGISGIAALAGGALVDIPKHWQSSQAQLPRSSYTIDLVTPYGNRLSRFLHIDIPLAMILAGALPLSTGKQSYTSPFLCEIYDQGRCQTRLGMIDSLSITRGTGNMGFNNQGQCMAMQVTFSVVDMSSIIHMPITEGFTLNPAEALFDEDTAFSDYMASLAGLGLADQIYPWRKLKINLTKQMQHWDTYFSKQHFANWMGGTTPGLLLSGFYRGVPR